MLACALKVYSSYYKMHAYLKPHDKGLMYCKILFYLFIFKINHDVNRIIKVIMFEIQVKKKFNL